jgi:hypothetical protein
MAHSANGSQCTSEERRPPQPQLGLRIRRWREPRGPGVPHRSDRAREDPGGHRQVLSAGRDRRGTQVSRAGTQEGACGRSRGLGVNRAEPASLGGTTRRRTGSNWLTQRVCSTRDTLPLIGVSERFVGDGRLRLSGRCDACPTVGDRRRIDAATDGRVGPSQTEPQGLGTYSYRRVPHNDEPLVWLPCSSAMSTASAAAITRERRGSSSGR